MTPKEKTVIRAIVKALRGSGEDDMNAFAFSYPAAQYASPQPLDLRAALLLEAMTVVSR